MKIGTITFHRAANYGAVLQSYALVSFLRRKGFDAEVIDYRSKFIEDYYNPAKLFLPKNWKRLIAYLLYNGVLMPRREKYFDFLKRRNVVSKAVYYADNLPNANNVYDQIISGSDQVWNYRTAGWDKAYFLDFVNDKNKKMWYIYIKKNL